MENRRGRAVSISRRVCEPSLSDLRQSQGFRWNTGKEAFLFTVLAGPVGWDSVALSRETCDQEWSRPRRKGPEGWESHFPMTSFCPRIRPRLLPGSTGPRRACSERIFISAHVSLHGVLSLVIQSLG